MSPCIGILGYKIILIMVVIFSVNAVYTKHSISFYMINKYNRITVYGEM